MSKRTLKRGSKNEDDAAPRDPASMDPNRLRDWLSKTLTSLSPEARGVMRDRLLMGLKGAGVDLGSTMLILGIPARTVDEVTSPEIAMLIRYVRINSPAKLAGVYRMLEEMTPTRPSQPVISRKAA